MAAAAALGGEYAHELRALKMELQASIARLGGDPSVSLSDWRGFQSSSVVAEASIDAGTGAQEAHRTTAGATRTPATTVSAAASNAEEGGEQRERQDDGTDARVVLRELTRAVRRREQEERQALLAEVQQGNRDEQNSAHCEDESSDHRRRHGSRRRHRRRRDIRALHSAIEELQRQRQEILRQIDAETGSDRERERGEAKRQVGSSSALQDGHRQSKPEAVATAAGNDATLDSQYSIGGVVTLEPLRVAEALGGRDPRFPSAQYTQMGMAALHTRPQPSATYAPRVVYPKTLDTLNDVFSIQLKFAETMLQLEQSVQARDQLLHGNPLTHRHYRRRRPNPSSRGNPKQVATSQDGILDTDVSYSGVMSSSSEGDDDFAHSEVSTVDFGGRQHRRRNRQLSTESSQQASTPSSSADTVRNASGIHSMAVTVSTSASAQTSPSIPESSRTSSPEHSTPDAVRQSVGAADVVTPSTGSSKKSDASSKQVHFGHDEFPTPLIARKFSFGSSDGEDDDHGGEGVEDPDSELSVLSLLEGSSVHSSELNDASFLQAFDAFRRELKTETTKQATGSVGSSSFAVRALLKTLNEFVTPEKIKSGAAEGIRPERTDDREPTGDKLAPPQVRTEMTASTVTSKETPPVHQSTHPSNMSVSEAELVERKRQLCLDIQSESATLALAFATDARQADAIRARLLALRSELSAVESQLASPHH